MKKLFIVVALFTATLSIQAQERETNILSRDTVAYNGKYELQKQVRENEKTKELSVSYYVILNDMGDKKVRITKETYEANKITAIIYNNKKDASRKISKAI